MGGIVTSPAPASGPGILGSIITGITTIASSGIFKTIRDNAKRKKAQEIANTGGYNTLSDYQKSLIGNVNPLIYGKTDVNTLPGLLSGVNPVFIIGAGLLLLLLIIFMQRENG